MTAPNPYAPSAASLAAGEEVPGAGVWREDKLVVMTTGAALPHRCVKCNAEAIQPQKSRKVYWHHPGLYALLILNILIYAIVAAVVRKRAVIAPGLCAEHAKRRRFWIGGGLALLAAAVGLTAVSGMFADGGGAAILVGALLLVAAVVVLIFGMRILWPKRITAERTWLLGAGRAFLDSLPGH